MDLYKLKRLLQDFETLPKRRESPTFLELCRYPGHRFEEIASRILCFYLDPKGPHGLKDTFLSAFFALLKPPEGFIWKNDRVRVLNEVNAEGKRLDILVYADSFALGIENKVTAGLYNPLEIYSTRISQYSSEIIFRVVLSLKGLTGEAEKKLLHRHSFVNITYFELFDKIRERLSESPGAIANEYKFYLNDFIQTIENMQQFADLNEQTESFFVNNSELIESLIRQYDMYGQKLFLKQKAAIAELKDQIIAKTGAPQWWAYQDYALGYNKFDMQKPKIGVEGFFETNGNDATGIFRYWITCWALKDWDYYKEQLKKDYPAGDFQIRDNRGFLHFPDLIRPKGEEILTKLNDTYTYLKQLVMLCEATPVK